eukprot:GDKJ01028419.1.p1 GENE.GDKJ01028419.1~~GDKJ01028419.1.p1  ORF type:complete len:277 (-),score=57.54 GDKJ01028419.1:51-842(-)
MKPMKLNSSAFFKLWNSQEFETSELAAIVKLRSTFAQVGGFMLLSKCVELGGALENLPGLDFGSQNVVCAGLLRRTPLPSSASTLLEKQGSKMIAVDSVQTSEHTLLVRVERGRSEKFKDCVRISIRSSSFVLSRAILSTLVELMTEFAPKQTAVLVDTVEEQLKNQASTLLQRYQQNSSSSTMSILSPPNLDYFDKNIAYKTSFTPSNISPVRSKDSAALLVPGNMLQGNVAPAWVPTPTRSILDARVTNTGLDILGQTQRD